MNTRHQGYNNYNFFGGLFAFITQYLTLTCNTIGLPLLENHVNDQSIDITLSKVNPLGSFGEICSVSELIRV